MDKRKVPAKQFVLFMTNDWPLGKLVQSNSLTERDFEGFVYDHDRNNKIEVWIKE